jgi:Rgp1
VLESAEEVDSSVSVRSASSVYRATRRVHGSKSEFTAFARRVAFAFEIPTGLAPSFETSAGTTPVRAYLTQSATTGPSVSNSLPP